MNAAVGVERPSVTRSISQSGQSVTVVLKSAAFRGMRPIDTSCSLSVGGRCAAATLLRAIVAGHVLCAIVAPGLAAAEPFRGHLRIIVPGAPGGGYDVAARAMQGVLQSQRLAPSVSVENIPAGGGMIGLANFVSAERGRGDVLMVSGLSMLMTTIGSGSPLTFSDVTPIARLTGRGTVVVVAASSPFRTFDDFIRAFRAEPEAISWTGGFAGGTEEALAWLIANAAGVDPKRVNYIGASGGESNPAIAGGHVSVGLGPLETMAPYVQAGTMRVLAVSSRDRDPSLDVPTLREQGLDVVFESWRAVFAPPGVSAADRQRLEQLVSTMARSPAWQETVARYSLTDTFLAGPPVVEFIRAEDQRIRNLFRRLGTDRQGVSTVGPYPVLVLVGFVAMVIVVAFQRHRHAFSAPARRGRGAVAALAGGALLNVALMDLAGFVLASTVLFWLTAMAFDPRRPWRHATFAFGLSVGAYVLFARLLEVTLPPGAIGQLVSRSI